MQQCWSQEVVYWVLRCEEGCSFGAQVEGHFGFEIEKALLMTENEKSICEARSIDSVSSMLTSPRASHDAVSLYISVRLFIRSGGRICTCLTSSLGNLLHHLGISSKYPMSPSSSPSTTSPYSTSPFNNFSNNVFPLWLFLDTVQVSLPHHHIHFLSKQSHICAVSQPRLSFLRRTLRNSSSDHFYTNYFHHSRKNG